MDKYSIVFYSVKNREYIDTLCLKEFVIWIMSPVNWEIKLNFKMGKWNEEDLM